MIYLALGRRETGKTTLAYYLAKQLPTRVIFDPRGLVPAPRGRARDVDGIDQAFDSLAGDSGADVVITPDRDLQAAFVRMSIEVRAWLLDEDTPRRLALLVDELRFVDTRAPEFDWLLRCATRRAVCVILTAHRPTDVPTDIRAIADVWLIFRTTQEHDLRVLAERCPAAVVDDARRLTDREFVAWDDTRGKATTHRDPARWFVPLRKAADLDDRPIL